MAYELTTEEFKMLLRNTKSDTLRKESDTNGDRGPIKVWWYSKATNELRFEATYDLDGEVSTYIVHSEPLKDEVQEPVPQLRIRVETLEELQEILNNYAKLRKEQENGV